jgi:hypothetical protein
MLVLGYWLMFVVQVVDGTRDSVLVVMSVVLVVDGTS